MIDPRQQVFLEEMGLGPLWQRRDVVAIDLPASDSTTLVDDAPVLEPEIAIAPEPSMPPPERATESMWDDDEVAAPVHAEVAPSSRKPVDEDNAVASMNWMQLKAAVSGCEQCGLCQKRTNTVFGVGDEKAKWLFIGEGPGRNEDLQGEPFVGPAGKLLDNMLLSLGLKRGDNAYIANIVKCRPTDASGKDRPPTQQEADACLPYLQRQIALIQPNVIVALGKTAAISLLKRDPETAVSSLRGTVHQYAGLPLIVTYHPAYLLRNLPDKRKAWADLCLAVKAFANAGNV
jgi:DNA polymerase